MLIMESLEDTKRFKERKTYIYKCNHTTVIQFVCPSFILFSFMWGVIYPHC